MEKFKDIVIKDRNFRLNKMDARKGSYMLFKVVHILTPLLKGVDLNSVLEGNDDKDINTEDKAKDVLDNIKLDEVASALFDLEEKDFAFIQDNCLKAVKELLSGRDAPVLDSNGNYGVLDVEDDIMLVMNLTVQSLLFQVSGFFGGNLLTSFLKG